MMLKSIVKEFPHSQNFTHRLLINCEGEKGYFYNSYSILTTGSKWVSPVMGRMSITCLLIWGNGKYTLPPIAMMDPYKDI